MERELLLDVAEKLRALADSIVRASEAASHAEPCDNSVPEKPPEDNTSPNKSLEDVRSVLGLLSRDGYTEQIRALIRKYGGEKLGDVDPARYGDLLKDAKEICDASE